MLGDSLPRVSLVRPELLERSWLVQGLRRDPEPNTALEPTPYSFRSCLASAFGRGSPRAFGANQGANVTRRRSKMSFEESPSDSVH